MMKVIRKHRGPSPASLRETPEIDFTKARVRRNPYAKRIAKESISLQVGRGRPKQGSEVGPTVPRSVRFPAPVWRAIEKQAKASGMPVHAALRAAVIEWLMRVA
jgi:hypothetical protein